MNSIIVIAAASPPVIGLARSRTAILANHVSVPGVVTILDGMSVETTDTPSNLNLANGGRLLMAPGSSARVHQDHLILDRGGAELTGQPLYRIETADFRIGVASPAAHVQVSLQGPGRVHVEAAGGLAEVRNARGLLVANVQSGTALQIQTINTSSTQLAGTVRSRAGKFFLTDEVSKVGVELRGENLASLVGKRVGIVGSPLAAQPVVADASQVIAVSLAMADFNGGPDAPTADTSTPDPSQNPPMPPDPPKKKRRRAALIIIGGAAVAGGTVGGLWAAGTIGGSSSVSQ
jgi:hypothetical protein